MTSKRFKKLLMARGVSRNFADKLSKITFSYVGNDGIEYYRWSNAEVFEWVVRCLNAGAMAKGGEQ